MKLTSCVIVVFFGFCQCTTPAPTQQPCLSDDDCSDDACCYKKHEFLVVSKKRQGTFEGYPIHNQDLSHVLGVCQNYHLEGDRCSIYDSKNGFCSCNTKLGMSCQYVHETPVQTSSKRQFPFGLGSFRCVKGLLVS